ncbi:MAG UNVERIFIED_CONTAM: hypothetical protein LVR18_16760 [Planctomycetaceae bacterium]
MAALNLKSLVSKLNTTTTRALEAAAGLCLSRSNYNVEIEHWLSKILETARTDLHNVLRFAGIDPAKLASDCTRAIDRLRTGNASQPLLSASLVDLVREAWVLASVEFGSGQVSSAHLLLALLSDRGPQPGRRSNLVRIPAHLLRRGRPTTPPDHRRQQRSHTRSLHLPHPSCCPRPARRQGKPRRRHTQP